MSITGAGMAPLETPLETSNLPGCPMAGFGVPRAVDGVGWVSGAHPQHGGRFWGAAVRTCPR